MVFFKRNDVRRAKRFSVQHSWIRLIILKRICVEKTRKHDHKFDDLNYIIIKLNLPDFHWPSIDDYG